MKANVHKFLEAVLGPQGAQALQTTQDRRPELNGILLPRVALSWHKNITQNGSYNKGIPGTKAKYSLKKNESGGFDGSLKISNGLSPFEYAFQNADLFHLSALVSRVLGFEGALNIEPTQTYTKLSKSLDELAKEGPSGNAGFIEPGAAKPPEAPMSTNRKKIKPKLPKIRPNVSLPVVKVEKSELNNVCPICRSLSFKRNSFVGCKCLGDLKKSVKTESGLHDSVIVSPGEGWQMRDVEILIRAIKRG